MILHTHWAHTLLWGAPAIIHRQKNTSCCVCQVTLLSWPSKHTKSECPIQAGVCSWKTDSGLRCHSHPGSFAWTECDRLWGWGGHCGAGMWCHMQANQQKLQQRGGHKRRGSSNKGLRKGKESLLAYMPSDFHSYRHFETQIQSLSLVFKKSFNNLPENP